MSTAVSAQFNDCASSSGSVRYVPADPSQVNQGKVVRDEATVKRAQEALGVKADGMWGNQTTMAAQQRIEQYQKDNGLEVTGRYSAETSEKMKKDPASKQLAEALDGMRNRDLLDRVYKPMKKEGAEAEMSCAAPVRPVTADIVRPNRSDAPQQSGVVEAAVRQQSRPKEPEVNNIANETRRGTGDATLRTPAAKTPAELAEAMRAVRSDAPAQPTAKTENTQASVRRVDNAIDNARETQVAGSSRSTSTYVQPVAYFNRDGTEVADGTKIGNGVYGKEGVTVKSGNPVMDIMNFIANMREGGMSMSNAAPPAAQRLESITNAPVVRQNQEFKV